MVAHMKLNNGSVTVVYKGKAISKRPTNALNIRIAQAVIQTLTEREIRRHGNTRNV